MNKETDTHGTSSRYQPSPVFLILTAIAVIVFVAAMFNVTRLPSYEQKREMNRVSAQELAMKQEAQAAGQTVKAYKKSREEKIAYSKLARETRLAFSSAVDKADNEKLLIALQMLPVAGFQEAIPGAYSQVIGQDNIQAFEAVLERGISCDYHTNSGMYAFRSAVRSESQIYFQRLLNRKCSITPADEQPTLAEFILTTRNKYRVLELPSSELDDTQRYKLMAKSISEEDEELSLQILAGIADINVLNNAKTRDFIDFSLRRNKPEVASQLILRGADVYRLNRYNRPMIVTALEQGYLEIARTILKKHPDYLKKYSDSPEFEGQLYTAAFNIKEPTIRLSAARWLEGLGIDITSQPKGGIWYLMQAIDRQDRDLVQWALKQGVSPRTRFQFMTALGKAKENHGDGAQSIILLLEQHGATDDLFELIRAENGIDPNVACSIGNSVEVVASNAVRMAIDKLNSDANGLTTPPTVRYRDDACMAVVMDCLDHGFGADDCVRSVPSCDEGSTNVVTACCPTVTKDYYYAARCAGLGVLETQQWMSTQRKLQR